MGSTKWRFVTVAKGERGMDRVFYLEELCYNLKIVSSKCE